MSAATFGQRAGSCCGFDAAGTICHRRAVQCTLCSAQCRVRPHPVIVPGTIVEGQEVQRKWRVGEAIRTAPAAYIRRVRAFVALHGGAFAVRAW